MSMTAQSRSAALAAFNDDDIFDEHGVLRDGRSMRFPMLLRDSASPQIARAKLVRAATIVAGREFATVGLTDAQIEREAVRLRLGDAAVAPGADAVHAQFETLAHGRVDRQNAHDEYVTGLNDAWRGDAATRENVASFETAQQAFDAAQRAYDAYGDRLSNAWKGPAK